MSPVNRREFLRKSAAGLASIPALSIISCEKAPEPPPPAPTGPPLGLPVGVQLYSVRNECEKDFEGTLKQVAAIGYKHVEVYDFYGKTAADVRKLLDANGLKTPSGHWMLPKLKKGLEKSIEDAQALGCEYIVMPILDPGERKTLDQFKRHAEFFNKVGEQCKKAGLGFAYHNHNFEFKTFGDVTAYDELLRLTDAELVKMELDCYWTTRAGKDPVDYLEKHPGRFPLLHVKDAMPGAPTGIEMDTGRGYFTEVGRGTLDWKRILRAAATSGMKHYYVEQDESDGSPLDSIRTSYEYLKKLAV